eukprot:TRINITY_DN6645_c0_g1_i1.p1 TRINITY_DN6645_c0_g1~~TRINITY_DN6645_c0_g1_i1.p1  ORF type:complete len:310 (+),score=31.20 TRINITY_DN6645_c0_g1_i1:40-930(+)
MVAAVPPVPIPRLNSVDPRGSCKPEPVILNIYDVTQSRTMAAVNSVALLFGGGVFHVGMELYRREWNYGRTTGQSDCTGVFTATPKALGDHRYRSSIKLGSTRYGRHEVMAIVKEMSKEWKGKDYHLIQRNCVHFAKAFARRLGVGRLPPHVDVLSRFCASFATDVERIWEVLRGGEQGSRFLALSSSSAAPDSSHRDRRDKNIVGGGRYSEDRRDKNIVGGGRYSEVTPSPRQRSYPVISRAPTAQVYPPVTVVNASGAQTPYQPGSLQLHPSQSGERRVSFVPARLVHVIPVRG